MYKNPFTNKKFIKNQFTFFTIAVQVFLCVLLNLIENLQPFFNFYERFFLLYNRKCLFVLFCFTFSNFLVLFYYTNIYFFEVYFDF